MTRSKAIIDVLVEGVDATLYINRDGTHIWRDAERRPHRSDGPAVEFPDGEKRWLRHGNLHRIDGPAVEQSYYREYYINGRQFTEDEFNLYVDQLTGEVLIPPGKKLTHDKK